MKTIKFEIVMDVDDDFVGEARRWEHHADALLDLDSYPEIRSIYNCQVTELKPNGTGKKEELKFG